jgi:hypothetical protein
MKPVPQYEAKVEQQLPAVDGVANLKVVGRVFGSHQDCWTQAKRITVHPILTLRELNYGTVS